jgi:hypothetical protein
MVAVDSPRVRSVHQYPKEGEEAPASVLDVRESHLFFSERLDVELAVAGEEPISSHVACQLRRLLRVTSWTCPYRDRWGRAAP